MTDIPPEGLTDEEFQGVAASVSGATYQFLDTFQRIQFARFHDREDAATDVAPLISGMLDGLLQWAMDPENPGDDSELQSSLIAVINEQMPLVRFNIEARKAGSVGEGAA